MVLLDRQNYVKCLCTKTNCVGASRIKFAVVKLWSKTRFDLECVKYNCMEDVQDGVILNGVSILSEKYSE